MDLVQPVQPTIKIYIAQALTKAPEDFKEKLKNFKENFCRFHPQCEILDFFGLAQGASDGTVFLYDYKQVFSAHLILDFVEIDSAGEGREAGAAYVCGIPVLSVAPIDWQRTRMVTGPAQEWSSHVMVRRYGDIWDVHGFVEEAIKHFKIHACIGPARDRLEIAPHVMEFFSSQVSPKVSGWKS